MVKNSTFQKTLPSTSITKKKNPIKLLLVDDEKEFVTVLSNRLRKRGIDVGKATCGSKAIQSLRRQDFDVALLDLKMEDMDGIEVLKIFKKMLPEMPIIILTGHGSDQAVKEGISHGAYDYLMKPCDIKELLEKIREAVCSSL